MDVLHFEDFIRISQKSLFRANCQERDSAETAVDVEAARLVAQKLGENGIGGGGADDGDDVVVGDGDGDSDGDSILDFEVTLFVSEHLGVISLERDGMTNMIVFISLDISRGHFMKVKVFYARSHKIF